MTRFSLLNTPWNGHKVHTELNFDFYPLSSISVSDLFATSLIVFFLSLWQIQKTCSDPAASDHFCRAGEEGLNAAAAYQRSGWLGMNPRGRCRGTKDSSKRKCLRKETFTKEGEAPGGRTTAARQRIPLYTDRYLWHSSGLWQRLSARTQVWHAVSCRLFRWQKELIHRSFFSWSESVRPSVIKAV